MDYEAMVILDIDGWRTGPCWLCGRTVNLSADAVGNVTQCDSHETSHETGDTILPWRICRRQSGGLTGGLCGGLLHGHLDCDEPLVVAV